jgi:type IV fimbrial biogenesis protein FimT
MSARIKRPTAGFTMIELMVTLAVLAILIALASPSFADYFERYRLRSAVDDALNVFGQARQAAVEADRNVEITVDTAAWCLGALQATEPTSGALASEDPGPCNCGAPATDCTVGGEPLIVNGAGRPGVAVSAVGVPFVYDSKGGTLVDLSATPQINFLSSSQRYGLSVQVNALGQARACVPSGKRPIPGYQPCT